MPKNSVVRIVGLLSFIVFAIIFKNFWNSRAPRAQSEQARLALFRAEKIIAKLSEYKAQSGTYPCFLSEVPNLSEFEQFDKPPYYQATDRGYQLFVENPGGQNLIRYHDSIEWFPCLYRDSCPGGGFLETCCGKPRYPKCDNHILPAKNDTKDCGHIPCEHLSEMVLGIVGKIEIPRPTRETFRSFREGTSMIDIFRAAGIPSKEVGSGLYVFIYQFENGQSCWVGTDDIRGKAHYVTCK